jgi:two-component system cell cycle response regulator DivK
MLGSQISSSTFSASVLVVDDHDHTRHRIATLLRARGYEVAEACDGGEALRQLMAGRFQAIVLDLIMPTMDSWKFRTMQMRYPEFARIPTVIVTVQALREPALHALRADDIVHKPFEDVDLLAAVERVCHISNPGQAETCAERTRLQWSRGGEVACARHAPAATTSRWEQEGWKPMPPMGRRREYRCQHCSSDGRRIHRRKRPAG